MTSITNDYRANDSATFANEINKIISTIIHRELSAVVWVTTGMVPKRQNGNSKIS